jgi:predicted enzyme related to lactoylglutathione lyase
MVRLSDGLFINNTMHTISFSRRARVLAGTAMLAIGLAPSSHAAKFPALNDPATTEHIPGKLVWADLITTDPDSATKFYTSLLGWTAAPIEQKGKGYVVFSNNGRPVAGLAPHNVKGGTHPARWIGYYSVTDIDAAVAAVTKEGGKVYATSHKFPDRGLQAIVADKDGNPIGLLQSSSGDSADAEPKPGDWNWFELYVTNTKDTGDFYHGALGLEVAPETNSEKKSEFVLSTAGQARGGIAEMPAGDNNKPSWLGVIRVANLDDTLAKVAGLGGEVLVPPHSVEYGSRFAIILDSTGGTVGLVQYVDNANPATSQ